VWQAKDLWAVSSDVWQIKELVTSDSCLVTGEEPRTTDDACPFADALGKLVTSGKPVRWKRKSARGRGKKDLTQRGRVRRDSAGEHNEPRKGGQEEGRWHIEKRSLGSRSSLRMTILAG